MNEVARSRLAKAVDEGAGAQDAEPGRFHQRGCTGGERRPDLAGQTGERVVERGDEQRHPMGNFTNQSLGLRPPLEPHLAKGVSCGVQERSRVIHFAQRLVGLLPHLPHDEIGQRLPAGRHRVDTATQDLVPCLDRLECVETPIGSLDRPRHLRIRRRLPSVEDLTGVGRDDGMRHGHVSIPPALGATFEEGPRRRANIRSSSAAGLPKHRRT